jgi:hypothetical protein
MRHGRVLGGPAVRAASGGNLNLPSLLLRVVRRNTAFLHQRPICETMGLPRDGRTWLRCFEVWGAPMVHLDRRPVLFPSLVLVVVLMLSAADCNGDEPQSSPPTPPPTTSPVLSFFQTAANTESNRPLRVVSPEEAQQILNSLHELQVDLIAAQIRSLDPRWANVTSLLIDRFVTTACNGQAIAAANLLLTYAPGALLEALPALMEAVFLIPNRCPRTSVSILDDLSTRIYQEVLANQQQYRAAIVTTTTSAPWLERHKSTIYKAACEAGTAFATYLAKKSAAGGEGGLAVAMGLAAGVALCPALLAGVLD